MKEVTIESIFGKTLRFRDYNSAGDRVGAIDVVYRDDNGVYKGGMVFDKPQVDALRAALAIPTVPVLKEFYLIRQRKDNPLKLKVMYANTKARKTFFTRADADDHQARMTRDHGTIYNFFVVEKEVK